MSMNLYIQCDGQELTMYQTPTVITQMCMLDSLGEVHFEFKGRKKSTRPIACYLKWVETFYNGTFDTEEDAKDNRLGIRDYIANAKKIVKNAKRIRVYQI
jgi:hypothetical protein